MQEKLGNLENFKMLMAYETAPTPIETKIIVVHSLNILNGLVCLDEQQAECEFPLKWKEPAEGAYHFTYRNNKNKRIIKLTATPTDKPSLVISFGEENSIEKYRCEALLSETDSETISKYDLTLKGYLTSKGPELTF